MEILRNQSLADYHTFGTDQQVSHLIKIQDQAELQSFLKHQDNFPKPYMILGGGSNVLFTGDYEGTILKNEIVSTDVTFEDEQNVQLTVGSGVVWHDLVLWSVQQGWSGIENLSLIPGTVGAAPIQNIGAYGVELKDVFIKLTAINLTSGKVEVFDKSKCDFGYRWSIFKGEAKGKYFITSITIQLSKNNTALKTTYGAIKNMLEQMQLTQPTAKDLSDAIIMIRQSKLPDPDKIGNAGSFFKNPIVSVVQVERLKTLHPDIPTYPIDKNTSKLAAGWLIEKAGWKGKRVGKTGTYPFQALVIINNGGATGNEIHQFALAIQADVQEKFNIELEMEVNII